MYKILLTGSSGFVGSNILYNLSNHHKFYIIVRKKPSQKILQNKNVKFIKYTDYKNLDKKLRKTNVDIVLHCATHYAKNHKFHDIKKFCESNLLLGNVILENLNNMRVKKFINFSTVWEDSNSIINNSENLYAAYKKSFSIILGFYKKNFKKIKFYELMLSDTFGANDFRNKIINTLKKNYLRGKMTKIISRNLYLNLLNVLDIIKAIDLIIKKKIVSKKYLLKNKSYIRIFDLIKTFNKKNKKKIKIKWISNKLLKKRIYPYDNLNGWKPSNSNVGDIINHIKFKNNKLI